MTEDPIVRRLDTIIAILKLSSAETLTEVRNKTRADDVSAEILDLAEEDFVTAGDLKREVSTKTGQSERTVNRRLGELLAMGLLEKRPFGTSAYKSTGLI